VDSRTDGAIERVATVAGAEINSGCDCAARMPAAAARGLATASLLNARR